MGIGYRHKFGDVEWNSNFTFTMNRNKIKELMEGAKDPETGELIADEDVVSLH